MLQTLFWDTEGMGDLAEDREKMQVTAFVQEVGALAAVDRARAI